MTEQVAVPEYLAHPRSGWWRVATKTPADHVPWLVLVWSGRIAATTGHGHIGDVASVAFARWYGWGCTIEFQEGA